MPSDRRNRPDAVRTLQRFFERRMSSLQASAQRPEICAETRCRHTVGHLVERTVARASLRSAVHDSAHASSEDASWRHHLMTAALTELRTLDV
jgi:hypothetical protein